MRRRDVSPEELARIIRLRQGNTSWLQIQRDTGVSRRIAQRAYEQWGRSQSWEELKIARKEVAGVEFRNHLDCLTRLAEFLVNALDIPAPSRDPISGEDVLHSLWQRDILKEYSVYGPPEIVHGEVVRYSSETCLRQNLILFKSLQVHTHEKVDWKILDEWQNTRDVCTGTQGILWEEAGKILLNILNQKPERTDRIIKGSGKEKEQVVERMVEGMLHDVWQGILAGKPDQSPVVQTVPAGHARVEVVFGEGRFSRNLYFTETDLAKEVEDTYLWAAKNLGIERKEDIIKLVDDVGIMRKAIDQLTEMLNPLMLRPLILRTRCDLCPA